jgi:hypothetical protein
MKRRLLTSLSIIATMLAIAGVAPADGPKCSEAILDGFYVFTASGFLIMGGIAQPVAIVEQIRFNGNGIADATGGRVSVNGNIFPTVSPGSYTVSSLTSPNRGCEGTLHFQGPPPVNLYMFIPPDARDIELIRTDPNNVFQGTATRVSH